jgi:gliding motility-associated-like protein
MIRRVTLMFVFLSFIACTRGQEGCLATLNYTTLSISRDTLIPGIAAATIPLTPAYDENHQRYFFQANRTNFQAASLYAIDAATGNMLYNPPTPFNLHNSRLAYWIEYLQYDNATDTLFSVVYDGAGGLYFAWLDPVTGNANIKTTLPFEGAGQFGESTFDKKDHWFIFSFGEVLYIIDAASGMIINQLTLPVTSGLNNVTDLIFDNQRSHLYAIRYGVGGNAELDSVSLSNGNVYLVAGLPTLSFPTDTWNGYTLVYSYTLDEKGGKYVFVAGNPMSPPACPQYILYVVDVQSGKLVSSVAYPYIRSQASIGTPDDIRLFCFDNLRSTLYGLDLDIPGATVFQEVTIVSGSDSICPGSTADFQANLAIGLTNPEYQWLVNGIISGGNEPTFSSNSLQSGDTVRLALIDDPNCPVSAVDSSNKLAIKTATIPITSVTVTASANDVCSDSAITFTAAAVNGGTTPMYQWQLDGANIGGGGPTYTSRTLANGDSVRCVMTGSLGCSQPAASPSVLMNVRQVPHLTVTATDTIIQYDQQTQLNASADIAITSYTWTPASSLDNQAIADPVAKPPATTYYQVAVQATDGCSATAGISIGVFYKLNMPNAFTPNGDGKNDVYRVPPATQVAISRFTVYNRWGERIYTTTNSTEGWDGRLGGQPQLTGTYIWEVQYLDVVTHKPVIAKGFFILIR